MKDLSEMIYRRKSVRSYRGEAVAEETIQKIQEFAASMRPLYPEIRVHHEIVNRSQVRCLCPWTTPQLVAIYSEEKDGYLENAGFLYQQLDLYLQKIGLGACWLGMGRMKDGALETCSDTEGLTFVIMLAFGYPKGDGLRNSPADFRRKPLTEISDWPDERLEPARLAPSSVNSQPWYFLHDTVEGKEILHACCIQKGLLKKTEPGDMNRIDMGIALAHMYVSNPESFRFLKTEPPAEKKNSAYIGSFFI